MANLPGGTGFEIDPNTGILAGTPTDNDVYASPIQAISRVTDALQQTVEQPFTLIVREGNQGPQSLNTLSSTLAYQEIIRDEDFEVNLAEHFEHRQGKDLLPCFRLDHPFSF